MKNQPSFKKKMDYLLFGWIVNLFYPQYYRPKYSDYVYSNYKIFFRYLIPQKIFRINGSVPWPVHFTSSVLGAENIKKGIMVDPGDNPGIYMQAKNGIIIGSNVGFGAGCKIISANHSHENHSKHDFCRPIEIGNHVFVGANSVILPGVKIGNNVVIGAGSVVPKDIPSNSIAVGNPCKVIMKKDNYIEDFSSFKFNKIIPDEYLEFIKSNSYEPKK